MINVRKKQVPFASVKVMEAWTCYLTSAIIMVVASEIIYMISGWIR